jgi:hypothetical protein
VALRRGEFYAGWYSSDCCHGDSLPRPIAFDTDGRAGTDHDADGYGAIALHSHHSAYLDADHDSHPYGNSDADDHLDCNAHCHSDIIAAGDTNRCGDSDAPAHVYAGGPTAKAH